jgi:hypothetical protein
MRTRTNSLGRILAPLVAVLCVFTVAGIFAAMALTAASADSGGVGISMSSANSAKAARLALEPMTPPLNDRVGQIHCRLQTLTLAYCNANFTGGQPLSLRVYVQYIVEKNAYKVWCRIRGVHGS